MQLNTVHKLTIGVGVAGALAFSVWAGISYARTDDADQLVACLLGSSAAIGLAVYLRYFWRKHR